MKNQVQLITYVDRLGGGGLADLERLLREPSSPLHGLFGGVHLLPFFDPIDGADAGFDPIDHTRVDPRLGSWKDLRPLCAAFDVMGDVIVNHVSADSPQFQDWLERGANSEFEGMFLTLDAVFPKGAKESDLLGIYRPRPGMPFTAVATAGGGKSLMWTTFTPQQIDINVRHPNGAAYLHSILDRFSLNGIRAIRLDAVGYAIKKPGTSCFMLPETFQFIGEFATHARSMGMEVLVEIHAYYQRQIEIAKQVDWVYDFALPPLVLHALLFGKTDALKHWIDIRPRNAITVLDTHDGIGIIDIGADASAREGSQGLVSPEELDQLVERIHDNCGGQSRKATGAVASNLDLYQVNCTFYDALARNDVAYLAARAIQFFMPGIPQVYYVGLLAGLNDMELLAKTQVGRDINRHRYSRDEINAASAQPVVQQLMALMRIRNAHPAFSGAFESLACADHRIELRWTHGAHSAELSVDTERMQLELRGTAYADETSFYWSLRGR
jgi:sucrose phosphorylase